MYACDPNFFLPPKLRWNFSEKGFKGQHTPEIIIEQCQAELC